jgi:predicted NAD/FAD-dependent oxidoreductase
MFEHTVQELIGKGYSRDEIIDEIDHGYAYFTPRTLHERRTVREYVDAALADVGQTPTVTTEEVLAEKARQEAAGLPAGIGSLARALHVSEATIRRRLGRLK